MLVDESSEQTRMAQGRRVVGGANRDVHEGGCVLDVTGRGARAGVK